MTKRLLVVCGLKSEAKLLAGRGPEIVLSGGVRAELERRLAAADATSVAGVVSFGFAGALDPALPVGTVVLSDAVLADPPLAPAEAGSLGDQARDGVRVRALAGKNGEGADRASEAMKEALLRRLVQAGLEPVAGTILGLDRVLVTAAEKTEARAHTGSVAVDMESHVAATWATGHGKPFAVLRVISDAATHDMPAIVGRVMRPDGGIYLGRLVGSLLRDPRGIAGLIRTGRDFGRALAVLRRVGGVLDERGLGSLGGGLLGLDLR